MDKNFDRLESIVNLNFALDAEYVESDYIVDVQKEFPELLFRRKDFDENNVMCF